MVKDISSRLMNSIRRYFTFSVRNIFLWIFFSFVSFFTIFSLFSIFSIKTILQNPVDSALRHETEKLLRTIEFTGDSVVTKSNVELSEQDFLEVTRHPFFLQIYDQTGKTLLESGNLRQFSEIPRKQFVKGEMPEFEISEPGGNEIRTRYTSLRSPDGRTAILQLSTVNKEVSERLNASIRYHLMLVALTILVIVPLSVYISRRTFRPVHEVVNIAQSISANNLKGRIENDAEPGDPVGRLRDTLNELFNRLDFEFAQVGGFNNNASHQLMNPLTALKTEIDFALRRERSVPEYQETLRVLNSQTEKMISIVKKLLILSKLRIEGEQTGSVINLSRIVEDAVAQKNGRVKPDVVPQVFVKADSDLMTMVAGNIVENALKYSGDEPVTVSLQTEGGSAKLRVEDLGIGIPDDEKEKVFTSFYRASNAQALGVNGYGLGLCLAKTIVTGFDGRIAITNNRPSGTVIEVTLPAVKISGD